MLNNFSEIPDNNSCVKFLIIYIYDGIGDFAGFTNAFGYENNFYFLVCNHSLTREGRIICKGNLQQLSSSPF